MKNGKEWLKSEILNLRNASNRVMVVAIGEVMELIDQLEEPEKVIIPQFVAEAFEKANADNWFVSPLVTAMYKSSDEVGYWLEVPSNEKLLLRAWLDGYEVEKEQPYYVLSPEGKTILRKDGKGGLSTSAGYDLNGIIDFGLENFYQLTEKEIKGYDERYWPFAVEVEE